MLVKTEEFSEMDASLSSALVIHPTLPNVSDPVRINCTTLTITIASE